MLKGLQGEIEEVLNGISLSVGILKELFHAYDFCCANMKLFFKVPADSWSLGLSKLSQVSATPERWAGGLTEATRASSGCSPTSHPLPSKRTGHPCHGNSLHPSPSPG